MHIAFITVNFHSDNDTLDAVSQLSHNDTPQETSFTIYVVDNSNSSTIEKELKKESCVIYIKSPNNLGFAAANNLGIKQALRDEADILVLINNDTIVPKNLIKNIISSPITQEDVGAVGGLIYFAKGFEFESKYKPTDLGRVIWYAGGKYDWDNVYASHIGVNEVDRGQFDHITSTDYITGCLFITKPSVLRKTGLFDERYCLYLEDSDLCLRIQKASFKLIFDPRVKISHKVAQGSGIGSSLNDYFITRNRLLFGTTYARIRTKFALYREAVRKLLNGTPAQKQAVKDFFLGHFGWGSWPH